MIAGLSVPFLSELKLLILITPLCSNLYDVTGLIVSRMSIFLSEFDTALDRISIYLSDSFELFKIISSRATSLASMLFSFTS